MGDFEFEIFAALLEVFYGISCRACTAKNIMTIIHTITVTIVVVILL